MGHDVFCVTQAFFFGARMCRPPVRDENVRIANCANCHFKIQDRGEVCAQSSAARAAMGHWGHSPHIPGMAGQCVVTFGGHTHTTTTTFGVADTVFDCGSGVVRWCARHPQHLGSPWGIGGNAPTPQGWQETAWLPLGATHTPRRPHSALPTPYSTVRIAVRVSYGGVHIILSI